MSDKNDFENRRKTTNKNINNQTRRKSTKTPPNSSAQKNRANNPKSQQRQSAQTQKPRPKSRPKKPINNKYSNTNTFTKVIFVCFIIFLIYGFGIIFSLINNTSIDSMALKSIDITKNDTYPAVIIRDETLYTAPKDGYVNLVANDYEKIKKQSLLFTMSDTDSSEMTDELAQVEDDIFNLQTFREEYSNYAKDIDTIQSEIELDISDFDYTSYSDINKLTNDLETLFETRKQIIFADQRIADSGKVQSKDELESQINAQTTKVYSQEGGVVSYKYDGLESTITPENMQELTIDQTKMDSEFKTNTTVETTAEQPVVRVVNSNIWYIGTYLPKDVAKDLSVGDSRNLFIDMNGTFKEVPAKVNYISDTNEDNVYVIFEMNSYMQEFMNKRNINVAVKSLSYMNMKVPTSAIVYKDFLKIPASYVQETNQPVVIKTLEDGTTSTVPITIEETDTSGNFYYLDKAKNDLLVGSTLVNPADATQTYIVPEVERVPGVYKINNGIATFTKITINEEIVPSDTETDYVYILPSANLKEYDRILVQGDSVLEGEIVE